MGEIADMILDGTLCQGCGAYIGNDDGLPGFCGGCKHDEYRPRNKAPAPKVKCDICGKKVKAAGINDHKRDAHQP